MPTAHIKIAASAGLLLLLASLGAAQDGDAKPLLTVAVNRQDGFELINIDIEGKNEQSLLSEPTGVAEPTWSPDGKRLACVLFRSGPGQIYVMNADGSDLKNITNTTSHERSPAWSPDGSKIVFTSNRSGNQDIFAMNPDGTEQTNLSSNLGYDADAAWSPDSKSIAFASQRDGKAFRVYSMKADGSEQKDMFGKDQYGWLYPAWSADGRQILYGGPYGRDVQLFVANFNGEGKQKITSGAAVNSYASWSPEGSYIAFVHLNTFDTPFTPGKAPSEQQPGGDLMLYDVVASTTTKLIAGKLPLWGPRPAWKPVGAAAAATK